MRLDGYLTLTREQQTAFVASLTPRERRHLADAIRERTEQRAADVALGECLPWWDWLKVVAPSYTSAPFADCHVAFWEWADTVHLAGPERSRFMELLWPRGFAKSTSTELAVCKWGACGRSAYALYVSATQDLADDHVGNIAAILESEPMAAQHPAMSDRMLGKFGDSKGWRRNRVRTASSFTVDAIGLDTAARGVKLEEHRPDVIVLDDIDSEHDTPATVAKKIRTLTQALLPAGTDDAVVVVAQNLVHANSIAKQLADRTLDMLAGARRIGPLPAVQNMEVEQDDTGRWRITAGEPNWAGMDLAACEDRIARYGLAAFVLESQQEITDRQGALWSRALIDEHRTGHTPLPLDRIVVAVDPNKTGRRDDAGIVVVGRAHPEGATKPHAYVLADHTQTTAPETWRDVAARALLDWQAGAFVVERTGLGDHAELTLKDAPALAGRPVTVEGVEAKISKQERARPVAQLYHDGRVHHVGAFPVLEGQQTGWVPAVTSMSPGGVDALVHAVTRLLIDEDPPLPRSVVVSDVSIGDGMNWTAP